MTEILYDFFRGASGFALIVIGLGFFLEPERQRIRIALGALFLSIGISFVLSWTSRFGLLPQMLDNLLLIAIVFVASQSLFELKLYLFGDEARRGTRRVVYIIGVGWSLLLWCLPFLDTVFGLPVLMLSIEDGRPVALFQSLVMFSVYLWPITIGCISLRVGRWRPSDVPSGSRVINTLLAVLILLLVILVFIVSSFIVGSITLYHLAQTLLQAMALGWYLRLKASPDLFSQARKEIGREHKKKTHLDPEEIAVIEEKLRRLEIEERIHTNPGLDPSSLAKILGIPVYRLSVFMTIYRGSSFAEWLHAARINQARSLLSEDANRDIPDTARAAGFSSLTVFKSQFLRRVGMTPEAYRAKNAAASGRAKRKVPVKG
ncbi:MAG: hypothetical protein A2Y38_05340 [Spirochaetes bacterium GWB1_59_5]|nr:MAG: hypothetical protein A2Y38_05340 [Spirochaetes bacterium GWB1_59_5]